MESVVVSLLIDACIAGSIAFLLTFFLIPILCWMSGKYQLVDIPDGVIKMHERPIPNLGGLAVYAGFVIAFLLRLPMSNSWLENFFIGITLLLIVGLADDRICFTPAQKFSCQFIVALFFLRTGFHLKPLFFCPLITHLISLLWILTVVNAFNLIDIMDGLATTVAICVSLTLLAIALYIKALTFVVLLSSFLGALIAFLWYNKPAACIYLGDAGALFIGGLLSTLSFLFPWQDYNPYGYVVVPFIFFIPLCELIFLIFIRTYKKIPFYLPSPDHFCMYLLRNGWSKESVLWYVGGISVFIFCTSILFFIQAISLFKFSLLWLCLLCLWIRFLTTRTV